MVTHSPHGLNEAPPALSRWGCGERIQVGGWLVTVAVWFRRAIREMTCPLAATATTHTPSMLTHTRHRAASATPSLLTHTQHLTAARTCRNSMTRLALAASRCSP